MKYDVAVDWTDEDYCELREFRRLFPGVLFTIRPGKGAGGGALVRLQTDSHSELVRALKHYDPDVDTVRTILEAHGIRMHGPRPAPGYARSASGRIVRRKERREQE